MAKKHQDDSEWDTKIKAIRGRCVMTVGDKAGNYKIIVAGLCDALMEVEPGWLY